MSKRTSNTRPESDSQNATQHMAKRKAGLMALEPRVLLDAAGFVTGVEGAVDAMMQDDSHIAAQALFSGAPATQTSSLVYNGLTFDSSHILEQGLETSDINSFHIEFESHNLDRAEVADMAFATSKTLPDLTRIYDMSAMPDLTTLTDISVVPDLSTITDTSVMPDLTQVFNDVPAPVTEDIGYTPDAEKPIIEEIGYTPDETASSSTIVFVDTSVNGYEALVADINPDYDIVLIGDGVDGVELMAATLEGREDVSAVHILSHGSAGVLSLGAATLDSASITGVYADEMAVIKSALSVDADIFIYGCDFGADAGAVSTLALATGADIAASNDDTGTAALGGNWLLEVKDGIIDSRALALAGFNGLLTGSDVDTDGDGVFDSVDIDDDNDGILDVDEGVVTIDGFTIGATVLTENGDGSGSFEIPVLDSLGNQVGSLTLNYTGFTGDGSVDGSSGTDPATFYTPILNVGLIGSDIALQLIYSVPDVNRHNFTYSVTSTGLDFTGAQHNIQGQPLDGGGPPGRVENGAFTIDHTLSEDPIALTAGGRTHRIDGIDGVGGEILTDGTTIDRISGRNANRYFNVGFNLGAGETYGVDVLHGSGRAEGIENTTFVFGTSVSAVSGADFDGDGIENHLDLDSDNDGITDNVEAQTTEGYIAPNADDAATYAANNGLNSAYIGTNGLTVTNTDGTDNPDYLDSDSDNDSLSDALERGDGQQTSVATGLSDAATDADGDGLFDVFEGDDVHDGFDVNDENRAAADIVLVGDPQLADDGSNADGTRLNSNFRDADTDNDGVVDSHDIDDDNDGILDVEEGLGVQFVQLNSTPILISGTGNAHLGPTGDGGTARAEVGDIYQYSNALVTAQGTFHVQMEFISITSNDNDPTDPNYDRFVFQSNGNIAFAGANASDDDYFIAEYTIIDAATGLPADIDLITAVAADIDGSGGITEIAGFETGEFSSVSISGSSTVPVVTGLGFENDAAFGGATEPTGFTLFRQAVATGTSGADRNDVTVTFDNQSSFRYLFGATGTDTGGITRGGQFQIGVVIASDTDGDGIANHLDIDSDNDGIPDNIEAQTTTGYIAPSGIGSAMVDTNGDGLDDVYDTPPNGDTGETGSLGLTPVNSDDDATTSDTTPDYLDTDSDNDGRNDTLEGGLGTAPATGLSGAMTDTDGDGLFDVFEAQLSGNVNDGFVVNENTLPLDGTLPDAGGDASVGTATPLVNDLDYRDLNDDPVANNDGIFTVTGGTATSFDIVAGTATGEGADSDPDGDTLSITQIIDPADSANPIAITESEQSVTLTSGTILHNFRRKRRNP